MGIRAGQVAHAITILNPTQPIYFDTALKSIQSACGLPLVDPTSSNGKPLSFAPLKPLPPFSSAGSLRIFLLRPDPGLRDKSKKHSKPKKLPILFKTFREHFVRRD
uniref:Uncharacterized protein n=1 Tax=Cucumis melo TaxID=3656 RepID=A0A9I9DPY5_CUCME